MSSTNFVEGNVKTFTLAAATGDFILVKKTTSAGQVDIAGAGEQAIGATIRAGAAGEAVGVALLSKAGTIRLRAAGVVAMGGVVYGKAAGLVDDTSATGDKPVGVALDAAAAAQDVIEVVPGLMGTAA